MRLWARAAGHMSLPSCGASPCVRARRGRIFMNQLCERAHPKPVTTLVLYRCSVGLSTPRWSCNPGLVPLLSAIGTALLSAWLPAARTKNRHRSCCVCRALPAVMPVKFLPLSPALASGFWSSGIFSTCRASIAHGNFVVLATVESVWSGQRLGVSIYCKSQQDGHVGVGGGQGVRYDTDAHAGLQVRLDADVKIC